VFVLRSVLGWRHDHWKLLYESKFEGSRLFDLRTEPGEQLDLSEREPVRTALIVIKFRGGSHLEAFVLLRAPGGAAQGSYSGPANDENYGKTRI
jgi:hypothetical protein